MSGFWEGRRVLVTGHTGFKGAWLCLVLERLGASVAGLALDPPTSPNLFDEADLGRIVEDRRGDVRDIATVRSAVSDVGPDVVFHLAAQALVRRSYDDPVGTIATNVLGTTHVLDAVRHHGGVSAVVVVTTDKCYRIKPSAPPYREGDELGGADPYSASKAATELVVSGYVDAFFPADGPTRVATARAGNVIGGGDWSEDRLVPDLVRGVTSDAPVAIRNPRAVRPWQHVLEPLAGYLTLAEALFHGPAAVGAWNFGPDDADARPVRAVADAVTRLWPGAAWFADDAEHPHEADVLRLDSTKARTHLGWAPRWGLDDALERTIGWYRGAHDGAAAVELCHADIDAYRQVAAVPS